MSHRFFPRPSWSSAAAVLAGGLALVTLVSTVTMVALVATAAPAHAGRRTITDERRDVVKRVGDRAPKLAPGNDTADIRFFVTTLSRQRLTLSTTVRELPRNYWAMSWQVRTDAGTTYTVDLLKTGAVRFALSSNGVQIPCEGMLRSVNPVKGKVTAKVPLVCLGSPVAVRAGAGAAATDRDFGRIFTDDAMLPGTLRKSGLKLGKTVKRG